MRVKYFNQLWKCDDDATAAAAAAGVQNGRAA